jgi:hypothetical protein
VVFAFYRSICQYKYQQYNSAQREKVGMKGRIGPSVELSAIIIRACKCGHEREAGKPCAGCGDKNPPKVTDLGVIASRNNKFWRRLKWNLWGYRAAQRRMKLANKEMCGK